MLISIKVIWLPKVINYKLWELESNLVPVITKKSTLFLIISLKWSNLLDREFRFKWHVTNLFIFLALIHLSDSLCHKDQFWNSYHFLFWYVLLKNVDQMVQYVCLPYFIRNCLNKKLYVPIKTSFVKEMKS